METEKKEKTNKGKVLKGKTLRYIRLFFYFQVWELLKYREEKVEINLQ